MGVYEQLGRSLYEWVSDGMACVSDRGLGTAYIYALVRGSVYIEASSRQGKLLEASK